nr:HNH endonuclease [Vibrio agarivorans]
MQYSEEQSQLIKDYLSLADFNHTFWSDNNIPEDYIARIKSLKSEIKRHYRTEQQYTCVYCKNTYLINHGSCWHIEHIIPKETNDQLMFESENLCLSCPDCNQYKNKKKVLIDGINNSSHSNDFIIVHPHYDEYREHILRDGMLYIPKNGSDKGKNTIIVCKLFRFIGLVLDGEIRDMDFYDLIDDTYINEENMEAEIEKISSSISDIWKESNQ